MNKENRHFTLQELLDSGELPFTFSDLEKLYCHWKKEEITKSLDVVVDNILEISDENFNLSHAKYIHDRDKKEKLLKIMEIAVDAIMDEEKNRRFTLSHIMDDESKLFSPSDVKKLQDDYVKNETAKLYNTVIKSIKRGIFTKCIGVHTIKNGRILHQHADIDVVLRKLKRDGFVAEKIEEHYICTSATNIKGVMCNCRREDPPCMSYINITDNCLDISQLFSVPYFHFQKVKILFIDFYTK
jgi:hypothetical protein